ncbi:MAG: pyridoxal phosphate-dependent decarboxylase family protein [Thermomicrobiales bacterium]
MQPDEFRRLGHQLIDWIAAYRAGIEALPVMAQVEPGAIKARFPAEPPRRAESLDGLFAELDRMIVPGLSHWQHPRFFGYFPANAPLESVLGDFLSTGLGQLGLSWQSSPALTELEEVVTDWFRQMTGLSSAWSGVIGDTASSGTLVALICARERASGFSLAGSGLQAEPRPLTVYGSDQSHSSVEKAALLAGLGRGNVRAIATDAAHAIRPDALAAAIRADLERGARPAAIVATAGTTATVAFDPLAEIAAIAAEHGIWLHVDATMAGSAMILPECRPLWAGVEGADSLVVNPHKWLGDAFDCSLYYVRDPEHLMRVMGTNPSFLQSSVDGRVKNLRDWGIPLGRRFRALKLWLLIRANGVEGLQTRLRRDLDNARWLADEVAATPDWRVLAPVQLQTVCLRHEPPRLAGDALDRHNLDWCDRINRSGFAYLTPATLDGRWMVRVSIGAVPTERAHVAALWTRVQAEADAAIADGQRAGGKPSPSAAAASLGDDQPAKRSRSDGAPEAPS